MTSYKKINIASEKILYYSYLILQLHYSIRPEHVNVNLLFIKEIVYNKIVRSLDYLNRCKVFLYVYINITGLV